MAANRSLVVALVLALLASCDVGTQPPVTKPRKSLHSTSYADPKEHALFKAALKDANVPHEIHTGDDGREYVRWSAEQNDSVARIDAKLFGNPLPVGRSIHFGEPLHEEFKIWLTENRISFSTQINRGSEYIVWDAADYPRIAQWGHFPRESFEMVHRLPSNTTPHADARDVPAHASDSGARAGGRER
jgi:hypothetical protein